MKKILKMEIIILWMLSSILASMVIILGAHFNSGMLIIGGIGIVVVVGVSFYEVYRKVGKNGKE